jgi:hypothetical protein
VKESYCNFVRGKDFMPRLQPPNGYITAKEAQERLKISDTLLRRYVLNGELKKYGPVGRTYKPWYKDEEIEALIHAQQILEEAPVTVVKKGYRFNPTSSFELAKEEDMPAIIDIDTRTFKHPAASLQTCLSWLRKNPHTFYVLKNSEGVVRAYASLIPMDKSLIDQFVCDELQGKDITADMVNLYTPGKSLDVYIMALAVDPNCSPAEKNTYGGRIILGLFRFILELGNQGVDIRTITARNYMQNEDEEDAVRLPDGQRLLRKIGFTRLRSGIPGVGLFVVNVAESGISIFERYSKLLQDWKEEHRETA